jgi:hypothetical protein
MTWRTPSALTPGQTHDLVCAQDLIENVDPEAVQD